MAWVSVILGIIQIVGLVLKNKFEQDAAEKLRKEKLHADWAEAIKSGDINRINDMLNRMRS